METLTRRHTVKRKHPGGPSNVKGKRMTKEVGKERLDSLKCLQPQVLIETLHYSQVELKRRLRAMEEYNKRFSRHSARKSSSWATIQKPNQLQCQPPSSDSGVDMPIEWPQTVLISDVTSANEASETELSSMSLGEAGINSSNKISEESRETVHSKRESMSGDLSGHCQNHVIVQKEPTSKQCHVSAVTDGVQHYRVNDPPMADRGKGSPDNLLPRPAITQAKVGHESHLLCGTTLPTRSTDVEQCMESRTSHSSTNFLKPASGHADISIQSQDPLARSTCPTQSTCARKRDGPSHNIEHVNSEAPSPSTAVRGHHETSGNESALVMGDAANANDVLITEVTEHTSKSVEDISENSDTCSLRLTIKPCIEDAAAETVKKDFNSTLDAFIQQSFADAQARKKLEEKIEKLEAINRELIKEAKRMKGIIVDLSSTKKAKVQKESIGIQVNVDMVPARPATSERATPALPYRIPEASSQTVPPVIPRMDSSVGIQRVRALPTLPLPIPLTAGNSVPVPTQYLQVQRPSSVTVPSQFTVIAQPSSAVTSVPQSYSSFSASTMLSSRDISEALTQVQESPSSLGLQYFRAPVRENQQLRAQHKRMLQEVVGQQQVTLSGYSVLQNQHPGAQVQNCNAQRQYPLVQNQQQQGQEKAASLQPLVASNFPTLGGYRLKSQEHSVSKGQHSDPLTTQGQFSTTQRVMPQNVYPVTGNHSSLTQSQSSVALGQHFSSQLHSTALQAQRSMQRPIYAMQGQRVTARSHGSTVHSQHLPEQGCSSVVQAPDSATQTRSTAVFQDIHAAMRSPYQPSKGQHPQMQNQFVAVPGQHITARTWHPQDHDLTNKTPVLVNQSQNPTGSAPWHQCWGQLSNEKTQEGSSSLSSTAVHSSSSQLSLSYPSIYTVLTANTTPYYSNALNQVQESARGVQQTAIRQTNSANLAESETRKLVEPMLSTQQETASVLEQVRSTVAAKSDKSYATYWPTLWKVAHASQPAALGAHRNKNTSHKEQRASKRMTEYIDLTAMPSTEASEWNVSLPTQSKGDSAASEARIITSASPSLSNSNPDNFRNTSGKNIRVQRDTRKSADRLSVQQTRVLQNSSKGQHCTPTPSAAPRKSRVEETREMLQRNVHDIPVSTGDSIKHLKEKPQQYSYRCNWIQPSNPKPSRNLDDVMSKIHAIALARQNETVSNSYTDTQVATSSLHTAQQNIFTSSSWVDTLLEGTLPQKCTGEASVTSADPDAEPSTFTKDAADVQSEHTPSELHDEQEAFVMSVDPEAEPGQISTIPKDAADVPSEHTPSELHDETCVMSVDPEAEPGQISTLPKDAADVPSEHTTSELHDEQETCVMSVDPEAEPGQISTLPTDAAGVPSEHTTSELHDEQETCVMSVDPEAEPGQISTLPTDAADIPSEHTTSELHDETCVMSVDPEAEPGQISTLPKDAADVPSEHTPSELRDETCVMSVDPEAEPGQISTLPKDAAVTETTSHGEPCTVGTVHSSVPEERSRGEVSSDRNQRTKARTNNAIGNVLCEMFGSAAKEHREAASLGVMDPKTSSSTETCTNPAEESSFSEEVQQTVQNTNNPSSELAGCDNRRPLIQYTEHDYARVEGPSCLLRFAGNQQRACGKAVREVVSQMFSTAAVQHKEMLMESSMNQYLAGFEDKTDLDKDVVSPLTTTRTKNTNKAVAQVISRMFETAEKMHKEAEAQLLDEESGKECSPVVQETAKIQSEEDTTGNTKRQSTHLAQATEARSSSDDEIPCSGQRFLQETEEKRNQNTGTFAITGVADVSPLSPLQQLTCLASLEVASYRDAHSTPEVPQSVLVQSVDTPQSEGLLWNRPPGSKLSVAVQEQARLTDPPCFVEGCEERIPSRDLSDGWSVVTLPSKPLVWVQSTLTGAILMWDIPHEKGVTVASFDVFARDCRSRKPIILQNSSPQWHKIGSIKAKPLPMALQLKLSPTSSHCITVRAVDVSGRVSPFSEAVRVNIARGQRL